MLVAISLAVAFSGVPATSVLASRRRASTASADDLSAFLGGHLSGDPMAAVAEDMSAEEFEVAVVQEERLLVDVYASWCGPCLLLAPEMDKVASGLEGRVRVIKFDSEQPGGPEIATSLAVGGLPTLLFVEDVQVVHRVEGALQASRILELADGVFFGGPMPRGPEYGDMSQDGPGRSSSVSMSADATGSAGWATLQSELDELPVFVCANRKGEPLQYERDGQPFVLFFAGLGPAQAELARASAMFPELELELLPVGLGEAYRRTQQGQAILVPSERETQVAQEPGGPAWAADALPLFGCLKMRKPREDGTDSMPLFMSSADAQAALGAAQAALGAAEGREELSIVCIPLSRAVELSMTPEESDVAFQFVPPTESVEFLQAYLQVRLDGSGGARAAAAAVREAATLDAGGGATFGGGIFTS